MTADDDVKRGNSERVDGRKSLTKFCWLVLQWIRATFWSSPVEKVGGANTTATHRQFPFPAQPRL
eukprot:scaffold1160_cov174-Ochromonas_danica.AAC.4